MSHIQKKNDQSDNSMINENAIALPLTYLPTVNWFAGVSEKLIIYKYEKYRKENHPNRCKIVSANGLINLNIPLCGGRNQKTLISDLKIAGTEWKRNHINSIRSAYGKAPYFIYYFDELEKIIKESNDNYFDLCIQLIKWLKRELIPSVLLIITEEEIEIIKAVSNEGKKYYQVFENKFGFQKDVSAIDLLFCMGPEAKEYLKKSSI